MNKIQELESEINEIRNFINNEKTPSDEKKMYGDMLVEMEKELDKLKSESSTPKTDDKKKETSKKESDKKHNYKLGEGYRSDFDYEGALKYALTLTPETNVNTIEKLYNSLSDVNYRSVSAPLWDYITSVKENKKDLQLLDKARYSAYENLLELDVNVEKPKFFSETKKETKVSKPKTSKPKKATSTKSIKGFKVISGNKVSIDGKEVDMDSADFCDYLLKKFKERRNKAKSSVKKKTPSVMERIASSIERSVTQALKTNIKDNDTEYAKNPTFFLKRVKELENATNNFLHSMKNVLGDEYDESEVSDTIKSIKELSDKIIEKYKKK